jgi:predicted nucleotidyltransferase
MMIGLEDVDDSVEPIDDENASPAVAMAEELARTFGDASVAVIHYGSRARGDARADSAYDFFVIVDNHEAAYETAARRVNLGVEPATAIRLSKILSPSVYALPAVPDGGRRNKCAVITRDEMDEAARLETRDHFVIGRLFQQVEILWSRDDATAWKVREALETIRARTFDWVRCYLPDEFTVDAYCRTLLETSFAAEIRPEGGERASDLFVAQRDFMLEAYTPILDDLVTAGVLEKNKDSYRQVEPPTARLKNRWDRYFRISKRRGTLRWGKAIVLYDGWLDYIVQKITRHNDVQVELTDRERKYPFIFLWPKVFQFFRQRSTWETRK